MRTIIMMPYVLSFVRDSEENTMKILLLGEFSSLHKYLKEGLISLGHNVSLASSGDGWKKIGGSDVIIPTFEETGLSDRISYYKKYMQIIDGLEEYDVIQLIKPTVFPTPLHDVMLKKTRRKCKVLSLAVAGGGYALVSEYLKGVFEYYCYDYDKEVPNRYDTHTITGKILKHNSLATEKMSDVIIPSHYEYAVHYLNDRKASKVIPFPINVDNIEYSDNVVQDKIVFFHGITRELDKGTPFIREALERLQSNYPNDVEIVVDGHMPFDQYVQLLKRTNVVVDQCCSYAYGINACLAMAQGKIVISGCREETLNALGVKETPMVLAKPDVDYLYRQMESIVKRKKEILDWGKKSRAYVEEVHDYKKVAQTYVDVWKATGKV